MIAYCERLPREVIAVGRPVTRPPPHRSRRAGCSHRALQQDSLPQVGFCLQGCRPRLGSSTDPWACDFEALQDCSVALPGITVAWATPVAPRAHHPHGTVEELFPAGGVPMDAVVMGGPAACGGQPLDEHGQPEVAGLLAPRGAALQGAAALRPCGPAVAGLLPLAGLAPPQRQPENLQAGFLGVSVPPARDDPRRGRRPFPAACLSSCPPPFVEACRVPWFCERAHTI